MYLCDLVLLSGGESELLRGLLGLGEGESLVDVDGELDDGVGVLGRNVLDVHAALGRGDHHGTLQEKRG